MLGGGSLNLGLDLGYTTSGSGSVSGSGVGAVGGPTNACGGGGPLGGRTKTPDGLRLSRRTS